MFLYQRPAQIRNLFHKGLCGQLAALHLFQHGFPFRGECRRFDVIRQHQDQVRTFFRWNKLLFLPLHKSGRDQFFQRSRTGGRGA